ncbi:MAG: cell wall hydrolase [Clostridia bacterium]|nr:cell wall hydrolase [Clostridia bacterium]
MKFRILLILTFLMTVLTPNTIIAKADNINFDTPITLKTNGKYIKTDAEPFLYDGLTYVPIRFVSTALGINDIEWNENKRTATISSQDKEISLTVGKNTAYVNGKKVSVKGSIKLAKDRVYVPVRFVSETLGAKVSWDSGTYTVDIVKDGVSVPVDMIAQRNYTDDDIYWLSRIVNSESGQEPMKGKIAVANTVINRVLHKDFPNTIYGVIFDRKYGVQFQPTMNGTIYNKPLGDSVIAAKRALRGENVVEESMYFLNPKIATNFWIVKNRSFYATIGNHDFYL